LIQITNLHKKFGQQTVLNGVSFFVPRGETLVILGRSGSGKSVLLKCLAGLVKPDSGSIQIGGVEVVGLPRRELEALRLRLGYVFQNAALYDSMTVRENLAFHLTRHRRMPEEECERLIREKLRFVGMEDALDKYPAQLSGGMQKRAGLARALVLSPEIVLYDEPTTGLDPITAAEIDDLIVRLKEEAGVTAISITHSLESAQRTADTIAVLYEGRILAAGTFSEIQTNDHPLIQRYFALEAIP
jgi:phospholipid/cholesterol/gamma-HCH transport system ATP-binding protein